MWTFLIIIIVLIIGKFLYDSSQSSSAIREQGGVHKKYSELINNLLRGDPRSKIIQDQNDLVTLGISGAAGSQYYYLQQTFNNLAITMKVRNNPLLGDITLNWTFPQDMDQQKMMEQMMQDMSAQMQAKLSRYQ